MSEDNATSTSTTNHTVVQQGEAPPANATYQQQPPRLEGTLAAVEPPQAQVPLGVGSPISLSENQHHSHNGDATVAVDPIAFCSPVTTAAASDHTTAVVDATLGGVSLPIKRKTATIALEAFEEQNQKRIKQDDQQLPYSNSNTGDSSFNDETNHLSVVATAALKKKRLCRHPGCTKVIKSQGHCQRHGARAKRCKVQGCEKQAQGTHEGMCKRHWKAVNFPEENTKKGEEPPAPQGESVYDSILPMSIAYRPVQSRMPPIPHNDDPDSKHDLLDPPAAPDGFQVMPLVSFLKEGTLALRPAGWHRNAERRAKGMFPVKSLQTQLEPWERQLALIEILLLSGGTPYANFKELAHAWGREKGFHHVLANSVCERRGDIERKKRSDYGRTMSPEEKDSFKTKLQKTRDKNGTSRKTRGQGDPEESPAVDNTVTADANGVGTLMESPTRNKDYAAAAMPEANTTRTNYEAHPKEVPASVAPVAAHEVAVASPEQQHHEHHVQPHEQHDTMTAAETDNAIAEELHADNSAFV